MKIYRPDLFYYVEHVICISQTNFGLIGMITLAGGDNITEKLDYTQKKKKNLVYFLNPSTTSGA